MKVKHRPEIIADDLVRIDLIQTSDNIPETRAGFEFADVFQTGGVSVKWSKSASPPFAFTPTSERNAPVFAGEQQRILEVENEKLFVKPHPFQFASHRSHRPICGLRFKWQCLVGTLKKVVRRLGRLEFAAHDAEAVLGFLRVVAVVAPVIPDAQRDVVGDVREEHAREIFRLRGLARGLVLAERRPRG
ncbi:MAG: hypothetical protein ABIP85_00735, partial [Chthoniobacteraceae bacterium]